MYFPTSASEFLSWNEIKDAPPILTDISAVTIGFAGFFISLARFIDPQFMGMLKNKIKLDYGTPLVRNNSIADPMELGDSVFKDEVFSMIKGVHVLA